MKKLIFASFTIVLLAACSQSNEQKAEVLIKESLKKTLYKPETYKPIETKVDSAFTPYDDPKLFEEMMELVKLESEFEDLEEKAKSAKSSMSLWSGPYQTDYGRNNYSEAKEEFDDANNKIEKLKKRGRKQYEKVVSMLHANRTFLGYKAIHNYRADNNAGNTLIGNSVFFIDKDFKEVLFALEVEEYNQIQEGIKNFKEQLEGEE